jgi:hypothetical protein
LHRVEACNNRISAENRFPYDKNRLFFDEPLLRFADGDEPLFNEYKKIITATHITPRESLSAAYHKGLEELPERISVISWILPITACHVIISVFRRPGSGRHQ